MCNKAFSSRLQVFDIIKWRWFVFYGNLQVESLQPVPDRRGQNSYIILMCVIPVVFRTTVGVMYVNTYTYHNLMMAHI